MILRSAPLLFVAALAGCGDSGVGEVKQWMEEVKRQTPVSIQKIPEPKTFVPFAYGGRDEVDPYNPAKLQTAFDKLNATAKSGLQPDINRRREPLENFPLDNLVMVGTLERPGLTYALLRVDRTVFQVKVGNYVGQNHGLVTRITDSDVEVREIVRDAAGEWTERKAKLELQESQR